jgi:hypothetical protein
MSDEGFNFLFFLSSLSSFVIVEGRICAELCPSFSKNGGSSLVIIGSFQNLYLRFVSTAWA